MTGSKGRSSTSHVSACDRSGPVGEGILRRAAISGKDFMLRATERFPGSLDGPGLE
jgi:hypothetical protein